VKKAAEGGDTNSQWNLAKRFAQGDGVDKNFKSAQAEQL
jgi:TPR repeat protein